MLQDFVFLNLANEVFSDSSSPQSWHVLTNININVNCGCLGTNLFLKFMIDWQLSNLQATASAADPLNVALHGVDDDDDDDDDDDEDDDDDDEDDDDGDFFRARTTITTTLVRS